MHEVYTFKWNDFSRGINQGAAGFLMALWYCFEGMDSKTLREGGYHTGLCSLQGKGGYEQSRASNNIVPRFIVVQLWLIKLNFYEFLKEHHTRSSDSRFSIAYIRWQQRKKCTSCGRIIYASQQLHE